MSGRKRKQKDEDGEMRIAIVEKEKCKPKKCRQECKRSCPVVRMGKQCIEVNGSSSIAFLSEVLCIGCGICVKKCPFEAISIINLPSNLESETTHRYGPNQFKLHRLPIPRPNQVLGLVGTNGIGKSTALKVLASKLKPNLGNYDAQPDWQDIVAYFRGSELQNYFTKILEDDLKPVVKPQYVDHISRAVKGQVGRILSKKNENDNMEFIIETLQLGLLLERQVEQLSGGELQRFAIAMVMVSDGDVYMFDEPSSYLDIKQRLAAGRMIRSLIDTTDNKYVIVVEHDLSVLDYLSDFICVLYGTPGAYGVVTTPYSVREGINVFLAGYVPTENMRFREISLNFKVVDVSSVFEEGRTNHHYEYPAMTKVLGNFTLEVEAGNFSNSEIIVLLGENGTGKTTFIQLLAGVKKPDEEDAELPNMSVSYKPQKISPKFKGSVRMLFTAKLGSAWQAPQFKSEVIKPLDVERLLDQLVTVLSGGEIQRVALVLCLGKPADIYLIDEPSAYLDSEQRIVAAKVIRKFIYSVKKTAFVVEHDFIMATYLADRVVVYDGTPSVHSVAASPVHFIEGMNTFLRQLDITFRRDPTNYRPRINKWGSVKDRKQKEEGNFFLADVNDE